MSQILRRQGLCGCFSIRNYGYQRRPNHYEILRIPENSTQKEIRDAFITRSKEMHPDSRYGSHDEFVKVNEAYKILSKRNSKLEYDYSLRQSHHEQEEYHEPQYRPPFANQKEWESYLARRYGFPDPHREKTEYEKRFENRRSHTSQQHIVSVMGLLLLLVVLELFAMERANNYRRDKWIKQSSKYEIEYKAIRNKHENQSDQENLENFIDAYEENLRKV